MKWNKPTQNIPRSKGGGSGDNEDLESFLDSDCLFLGVPRRVGSSKAMGVSVVEV